MPEDKVIDVCDDGGLLKEILVEGSGPCVPSGVNCRVHYTGTLLDGTEFDSSVGRGEPFSFMVGKGKVIKGWDEGVKTMKKGEKAMLTCRSDYAYGKAGSLPKIPPDATLKFEVEVLDWDAEDLSPKNDKGILRYPIHAGAGIDTPKSGAEVEVTLVGESDGKEFFNKKLKFNLDEGTLQNVPYGIEKALKKMVKGEKSKIVLKPEYGFGSNGNKDLGVAPYSTLTYTVTLHSYEIVKDSWMMSTEEKLEHAKTLKEKGNNFFKSGYNELALKMYKKVVTLLEPSAGYEKGDNEQREALLLAGHLNVAATRLKVGDNTGTVGSCDRALELDKDNVKALFRRGQAYLNLSEPQLAKKDFTRVTELEPSNKAAFSQIAVCQKKAQLIKENEKKIYANMFDKFARKDREKEEEKASKEEDVLAKVGEWGANERDHEPTDFEKENPNILLLDKDGDFKDM